MIWVHTTRSVRGAHRDTHMGTIDNFYIIEVDECLGKCEFSLGSRLFKTTTCNAAALAIITAISSGAFLTLCTSSSSSDGTAPDNVEAIVINGNRYILLLTCIQLEVAISRYGILEEALVNRPSLDAFATLEAIAISATLGILTSSATD